jgi:hypothetical protein
MKRKNIRRALRISVLVLATSAFGCSESTIIIKSDGGECGDGTCSADESHATCPSDCESDCGDGFCTHLEDSATCPGDCPVSCGDGGCDTADGETASNCPADCPATCGDGLCTHAETRTSCYEDCGSCGDGFCTQEGGESIWTCAVDCGSCGDAVCSLELGENAWNCITDCGPICGDTFCTHAENAGTCPKDCVATCGDGFCTHAENVTGCYADCGWCGDGTCNGPETVGTCSSDCEPQSCTLVYDLPHWSATNPSRFRIDPQTFIASAFTVNVGPGRMIVRVPRNTATGGPAPGTAELLYYDMDLFFGPNSGVMTETRQCLLEPGVAAPSISAASTPPEQVDVPQCIRETNTTAMATGTFKIAGGAGSFEFSCYDPNPTSGGYTYANATGTAPGCMQTFFSYGRVWCASGAACGLVLPVGVWIDKTSPRFSQHFLNSISLSSNLATLLMGNPGGAGTGDYAHVPNADPGWTGFALRGVLDAEASTCNMAAVP